MSRSTSDANLTPARQTLVHLILRLCIGFLAFIFARHLQARCRNLLAPEERCVSKDCIFLLGRMRSIFWAEMDLDWGPWLNLRRRPTTSCQTIPWNVLWRSWNDMPWNERYVGEIFEWFDGELHPKLQKWQHLLISYVDIYVYIYIHIYVVTVLIEIVFVIVSQKPARWLWGAFASVVILLAIGVFSSFIASISSTLNTLRMSRVENSKHLDWWNGWRKQCPVSIPVKNNSPNILLMDQNPGFYSPVEVGR